MGKNWDQRAHWRISNRGRRFLAGKKGTIGEVVKIPTIPVKYTPGPIKATECIILRANLAMYGGIADYFERRAAEMHKKDPKWWRTVECYAMEGYARSLRVWLASIEKRLKELDNGKN